MTGRQALEYSIYIIIGEQAIKNGIHRKLFGRIRLRIERLADESGANCSILDNWSFEELLIAEE